MVSDTPPVQDLSGQELYVVVRKAVEDAIISAVGTLLLALLAFGLVWFGMLIGADAVGESLLQTAAGGFMIVVGLYFAGSALGVIPSPGSVR
jgi:hypothetical protein